MLYTMDMLMARRSSLLAIFHHHQATNVQVFGSVSRGEATEASDVDFLVDMPTLRKDGLFALMDLIQAVSNYLGCSVDIVPREIISDKIRYNAYNDAKDL